MRTPSALAILLLAVAMSSGLLLTTGGPAAAATLLVDDNLAECPTAPHMTIQAAVNAASPGDTIQVCAGNYPELAGGPLTINKTLTLEGAQAGVDARTRGGPESIIADLQGTAVSASNVVIDGFTVQSSSVAAFTGYGIWLNPGVGVSGTQIVNNIIQDNIVGIGLANAGPSQAVIRHNLIRNNIRPGGASGSGIYTDQFSGGATVRNVLVEENTFSGHAGFGGAINISNTSAVGGVFDLDVRANRFDMNSRSFVLFNTHDSTFTNNAITGSTFVASADVRIFDNNTDLLFTNNDLSAGVAHAIRLSFLAAVGGPSSDVEFHQNNIEDYALTGLTVDPGSHDGTVDAECNWWNSPSGPTNAGNPGGSGEEVVGDADFRPWLTARAPGGPCFGGVVSTPGKVTGGGRVEADTTTTSAETTSLDVVLELATLLIDNGSGPASVGSKATFGLSVACCSAKGNLEYNDHDADIRIKATSVATLVISEPSTACPTGRHAQFSGNAKQNGTNVTYIVDVDDCGEPGSGLPDRFRIETTGGYEAEGPLIGGNIKIH